MFSKVNDIRDENFIMSDVTVIDETISSLNCCIETLSSKSDRRFKSSYCWLCWNSVKSIADEKNTSDSSWLIKFWSFCFNSSTFCNRVKFWFNFRTKYNLRTHFLDHLINQYHYQIDSAHHSIHVFLRFCVSWILLETFERLEIVIVIFEI